MAVQEEMMMNDTQNHLGLITTDWLLGEPPNGSLWYYTAAAAAAETDYFAAGFLHYQPYHENHDDDDDDDGKVELGFHDMGFVHGGLLLLGRHDMFRQFSGGGDDAGDVPSSSMNLFHGGYPHQSSSSMPFSLSLVSGLDSQRREIDSFLKVQGERLKCAVEQQREKQMGELMGRIESRATTLMKEKEENLATARHKTKELEEWLRRAEIEMESYERAAIENEAMAMELNSTLQHIKQKQWLIHLSSSQSIIDDEASAHEGDSSRRKTGASRRRGWCRGCNGSGACMLFLPCKHLCCCKSCDGFLQLCPICQSPKQTTIEVHLS